MYFLFFDAKTPSSVGVLSALPSVVFVLCQTSTNITHDRCGRVEVGQAGKSIKNMEDDPKKT